MSESQPINPIERAVQLYELLGQILCDSARRDSEELTDCWRAQTVHYAHMKSLNIDPAQVINAYAESKRRSTGQMGAYIASAA